MKLQVLSAARDKLAVGPFLSAKAEARINTATELTVELPRPAEPGAGLSPYETARLGTFVAYVAKFRTWNDLDGLTWADLVPAEPGDGLSPYEAARLGTFLELLDDAGNLLASGVVTSRRLAPDRAHVTALTEEVLLEAHTLPRGYAACLVGLPITDLARALLWGREVVQITTQAEWEAGTLTGLDTTTEPGVVMLAKDGSGAYLSQGTGRWTLTSSGVPGWQAWERIRWLADHDEVVSTELRYRKPGGSWSPWASGGLPAEVGVEVVGDAAVSPTLEVEVRLTTTDTTSPDPDDNPVGVTPYLFALEAVARTEPVVTEGSIPATEPEVPIVYGLDPDADNALKVLSEACEAVGWEFRVRRGELDVAHELGDDRTDAVLLREGTNLRLSELGEDDREWANVVTAYGPGEGIDALVVTRRHAQSIADHGFERRRVMEFPNAADRADLIDQADEWLAEHAYPSSRFAGDATYPAGTEPLIRLGDKVRVVVPSSGLIRTVRVTELIREERAGEARLALTLGTPERGLLEAITEPAKEVQRRLDRRPLGPPVGFRLAPGQPGLRALLNPYPPGSSAATELRYSTVPGFDPEQEGVRVDLGRSTRASIPNATPGVRYYARARAYDATGRRSAWSDEVSAVAGGVVAVPPDGSITIAKFAAGLEPIRIVASLPLVPDPAYKVGSIVLLATGPADTWKLYRLVSETGVPSEDWRPVVNAGDLAGQIGDSQIQDGAITAPKIALQAVDADRIAAEAVTAAKIAAGAVEAGKIAAGAVGATHITDGAISTPKLAANAVTAAKIAAGAVEAGNIAAGAVTTAKLAAEAVTTDKLAALAVTADKIAANAVTAAKIAAGAVEADKIAAGAVEADKIAANAVTAAKIAAGAVTADKIAANAVTAGKLAANAVTAGTVAAGAIGAEEIAAGAIRAEHLALTGASYHVNPANDHVLNFEGTLATSKGLEPEPGHGGSLVPGLFGRSLAVLGAPVVYPMGTPTPEWTLAAYVAKLRTWNDLDGLTWADL